MVLGPRGRRRRTGSAKAALARPFAASTISVGDRPPKPQPRRGCWRSRCAQSFRAALARGGRPDSCKREPSSRPPVAISRWRTNRVEAREVLVALITVATLLAVMLRPRGIAEALSALVGGALVVAVGAVPPVEAAGLLLDAWNVFGFFLGLMLIAAAADHAGVFDVLAWQAARRAGGSQRRLLVNVFAIGVVLAAFLSNDATALILTPVVYTLVARLGLPARPYAFACTFIADTASFLLPVSNPINILVLQRFPQPLGGYLQHLLPAALAAIAVNVAAFLLLFRNDLRRGFDVAALPRPAALDRAPRL